MVPCLDAGHGRPLLRRHGSGQPAWSSVAAHGEREETTSCWLAGGRELADTDELERAAGHWILGRRRKDERRARRTEELGVRRTEELGRGGGTGEAGGGPGGGTEEAWGGGAGGAR